MIVDPIPCQEFWYSMLAYFVANFRIGFDAVLLDIYAGQIWEKEKKEQNFEAQASAVN